MKRLFRSLKNTIIFLSLLILIGGCDGGGGGGSFSGTNFFPAPGRGTIRIENNSTCSLNWRVVQFGQFLFISDGPHEEVVAAGKSSSVSRLIGSHISTCSGTCGSNSKTIRLRTKGQIETHVCGPF